MLFSTDKKIIMKGIIREKETNHVMTAERKILEIFSHSGYILNSRIVSRKISNIYPYLSSIFTINHHRQIVRSEIYSTIISLKHQYSAFTIDHSRCTTLNCLSDSDRTSRRVKAASIVWTSLVQRSQTYAGINVKCLNFFHF